MDKLIRLLTSGLLGFSLFSAGQQTLQAGDCTDCGSDDKGMKITLTVGSRTCDTCRDLDAPNPFTPKPILKESTGAKFRHALHDIHKTWDAYFEVYPDELANFEPVLFRKVISNPAFYLDRKIQFDVMYAKEGKLYRPFISPYAEEGYVNFNSWPYTSDLWTTEGRGQIHPLFYVDKRKTKLIDKIQHLPAYTPIHVWAYVGSKSEGLPWFEVLGVEIIPETTLSVSTLRHLELGSRQIAKKRFDLAAQSLETAICLEIPVWAELRAYSMLGRAYWELRDYRASRNALANAILRDDTIVSDLVLLARVDNRLDRADEAKQAATRALELDPANPEARAELGLSLAILGDFEAGYKELDYAQKLAPRNQLPEVNRNRAMIAFREGKLDIARKELDQAVILRATDYSLHLELGDVLMAMNNLDDAKKEYGGARTLAPARPEPFFKYATVVKAQADALKAQGKTDDANKAYTEALDNVRQAITKGDKSQASFGLETDLLKALGRESEIRPEFKPAPPPPPAPEPGKAETPGPVPSTDGALTPPSVSANDEFDAGYEKAAAAGDWVEMEKITRAAIASKPSAKHYTRLGNILASRPNVDLEAAVEAFEQSIKLNPESGEAWAALGHIRVRHLSDWTAGASALIQAVKFAPQSSGAWYDLAIARRNLGQVDGAVAAADEAARLNKSVETRLFAAQVHLDRGQIDAPQAADIAKQAFAEATIDSDRAWAQSILGGALVSQGKAKEGIEQLTAADPTMSKSPEHNLWFGVALMRTGDLAGAKDRLNVAIDQSKRSASYSKVSARVKAEAETAQGEVARLSRGELVEPTKESGAQSSVSKPTVPTLEEENGKNVQPTPTQAPGPRAP